MKKIKFAYRATHTGIIFSIIVAGVTLLTIADMAKAAILVCIKPVTRIYLEDIKATYASYTEEDRKSDIAKNTAKDTTKPKTANGGLMVDPIIFDSKSTGGCLQ
ncbi:hypothetical protein K9M79_06830 [Candidatus Woesearchaeota archaeon]|nr:hypothetical protein [Candidatus Woesearchaeota archaeon]